MTDFQKRIVEFLNICPNGHASTFEIAIGAFPEKWKRRAGHAAIVGHIDRAGCKLSDIIVRLPAKGEHGCPTLCLRHKPTSPGVIDPERTKT